jgi:Uncharacterized membrane protein (homolog of Drosophila rhomboid)
VRTTPEPDKLIADGDAPESGWAEAGRYASEAEGFEHGLVVLAMGGAYWLREEPDGNGYRLLVPEEAATEVRTQLELFDRESRGWPPPRRESAIGRKWGVACFLSLLWVLIEMGAFAAQIRRPWVTDLLAMDARALFAGGEWWRPFTALFLHADLGHLATNLGGGVFLVATVLAAWGARRGGVLLAGAAMAANAAVGAVYYPSEYRSLGASTALFAALGLLTGRAARRAAARASGRYPGWRVALTPLAAGTTMLMLFGAGDLPVDVPAHAAGFVMGLVAGGIVKDS